MGRIKLAEVAKMLGKSGLQIAAVRESGVRRTIFVV